MPDTMPIQRSDAGQEDILVSLRRLVADRPEAPAPLRLGALAPLVLGREQRVEAEGATDDALCALVARAVRDELRGEVGAHLTRRLRRMVREEIALALQGRDLDR